MIHITQSLIVTFAFFGAAYPDNNMNFMPTSHQDFIADVAALDADVEFQNNQKSFQSCNNILRDCVILNEAKHNSHTHCYIKFAKCYSEV